MTDTKISRMRVGLSIGRIRSLPNGVFVLFGIGLGILLARLIVSGAWPIILGLMILVPAVILFLKYPFAALMIWLLFSLLLQTTPDDPTRIMYWMIHRAIPPLALGLVTLRGLFKVKDGPAVRLGPAGWAMVAFLGWSVVNIFWFQSSPIEYLYLLYDRVVVPMCLYGLVRLIAPRESDLRWLVPAAAGIVVFETVVGLLSWLAPTVIPQDWVGYTSERTIGTLGYYTAYSTTLVFYALLLFQYAMHRKPGLARFTLIAIFGLGVIGVFLSFSRGSWLGGLAVVAGLLLIYPRTVIRGTVFVFIIMAILGASVLSQQMAFAQERLNSEDTAMDRWVIWDAGMQMIELKPLFGWGYGNYTQYAWQFQRRVQNYVEPNHQASHNSYIGIAAEMGVPALLLFAFPVLWWLHRTRRVWPHLPRQGFWGRSLLVVLWLVIVDQFVVSFFSDMRVSPYAMGLWWITLGFIGNLVDRYSQVDDARRKSSPELESNTTVQSK